MNPAPKGKALVHVLQRKDANVIRIKGPYNINEFPLCGYEFLLIKIFD